MGKSKGKWFSAWTGVGTGEITRANCKDAMTHALIVGANHSRAMQWQISSVKISQIQVAAFLIARGPSAVIAPPPYDQPILSGPPEYEGIDANFDPGHPLGLAQVNGATYKRSYSKAEVSLDCGAFTSRITFKSESVFV